ncbi:MAG: type I secretion system permease/ATPase [Microgenomates group bacterium]
MHSFDKPRAAAMGPNTYKALLKRLRPTFVIAGLFSAVINVLMLTGSIYMLQVYDRVLPSGSVPTLVGLFVIVVVLHVFLGFYDFLRTRLLARAAVQLDVSVGAEAFRGWIGTDNRKGQPLRDMDTMRGFLSGPAMAGVFDVPWVPLYLGILFVIHAWLGLLTLAGAAIVVVIAFINHKLTHDAVRKAMVFESDERSFAAQCRRSSDTIHAMGMKDRVTTEWERRHHLALAAGQTSSDPSEVLAAFSQSFRMLLQSGILTMGAYLVLKQEMSAGMIVASSILSGRALAPVDRIIGQWRMVGRATEAHQRLTAYFSAPTEQAVSVALPAPSGKINVTRLTKYIPNQSPTATDRSCMVKQISFDLAPGDGLGVIGNSASGKSTLAKLLVGALRADEGEIRLDGATRDHWDQAALGRYIGYLPQTVEMLPGSIRDNISRFDPAAPDRAVIEAAKLTGVHEMILALPYGYSTPLGGEETPLSGGQMQRLGLARAVYGMPQIVVLDEPNSNLDAAGNDALAHVITALRDRGSVVIVMAHRPNVIAAVNKVLVLQSGTVSRFGLRDDILGPTSMDARPTPSVVYRSVTGAGGPSPLSTPIAHESSDVETTLMGFSGPVDSKTPMTTQDRPSPRVAEKIARMYGLPKDKRSASPVSLFSQNAESRQVKR